MLKLKTPRQVTLIVNNVVRACADVEKLNRTGYGYLYLCSGFIAYYNLQGFIDHYKNNVYQRNYGDHLRTKILLEQSRNQCQNFRTGAGWGHYEYYQQKAKIYNLICGKI